MEELFKNHKVLFTIHSSLTAKCQMPTAKRYCAKRTQSPSGQYAKHLLRRSGAKTETLSTPRKNTKRTQSQPDPRPNPPKNAKRTQIPPTGPNPEGGVYPPQEGLWRSDSATPYTNYNTQSPPNTRLPFNNDHPPSHTTTDAALWQTGR